MGPGKVNERIACAANDRSVPVIDRCGSRRCPPRVYFGAAWKSIAANPVLVPKKGLRISTLNPPRMVKGSIPTNPCLRILKQDTGDDRIIRQRGSVEGQDGPAVLLCLPPHLQV